MIITIDDNNDLNELTQKILTLMGFEVISALSGEEGIKKARKHKAKVILCDIGMADMNGHEVAEYIRADQELKDTYLIAVSGYSRPKDIEKSIESGFNKHLSKPIDYNKLKEHLNEIYKSL